MTKAWQGRLDEGSSVEDVLRVVAEFLSFWTAEEWQVIPEDCRPGALENAQQVNAHAFRLARLLTGTAKTDPELHRMSTFFTKASLRIFEIAAQEDGANAEGAPPERLRRRGGSQSSQES